MSECIIPIEDITKPLPLERWLSPGSPLEIEIGCGNGRFLATRAERNPDTVYIGIERMLERVRKVNRKAINRNLPNLHVYRLEALYTFTYQLPLHGVHAVYVFFPDPWPKKKHHSHRLFSQLFLDALWARLETGGEVQVATDDLPYFEAILACFAKDKRFAPCKAIERDEDEKTDFELLFRGKGMPIYSAGWKALPVENETPLPPLKVTEDMEPKERP